MMNNNHLSKNSEKIGCVICGIRFRATVFLQDDENGDIVACNRCGLSYKSPHKTEGF